MSDPYKTDKPGAGSGIPYLTKGTRVIAQWFGDPQAVALAGVQMKFQVTDFTVTGTICHLRGDDPIAPTKVDLYIQAEDPVPPGVVRERPFGCTCPGHDKLVRVNADHVRGVLHDKP